MHPQRLPYNFILKVWVRWACISVVVAVGGIPKIFVPQQVLDLFLLLAT